MKRINAILKEIETNLRRINFFVYMIKALTILMVSFLIFFMIGLNPFLSIIPALVYFISSFFVEDKIDKVLIVEKKYQMLNEKIRTARDYKDRESPVLAELESEIVSDIKDVRLSSFVSYTRIFLLVLLLVSSVSASLYIASNNIKIMDFNDVVRKALKNMDKESMNETQADFTGGQVSIMQVGNERVEVEINPVGIDFDFSEVSDAANYEFSTSFPKEVFISSGAAYEQEFTEEQQMLIKKYFEKKKTG